MDITFVLFAIISTLLAIVVATSLFNGFSPAADFANARSYFGHRDGVTGGLDQSGPKQNGHLPDKKKKKEADDWCEISGSSHDHWDVVKSVLSVSSLSVIRLSFSVNTEVCVDLPQSVSQLSLPLRDSNPSIEAQKNI